MDAVFLVLHVLSHLGLYPGHWLSRDSVSLFQQPAWGWTQTASAVALVAAKTQVSAQFFNRQPDCLSAYMHGSELLRGLGRVYQLTWDLFSLTPSFPELPPHTLVAQVDSDYLLAPQVRKMWVVCNNFYCLALHPSCGLSLRPSHPKLQFTPH